MKTLKTIIKHIPEIILLSMIALYWINTSFMNPIAFLFFAVIIVKLFVRNTVVDFISAGIFIFASLFILMAVLSEYNEFVIKNDSSQSLLLFGLLIFGLIMISAVGMGIKTIKESSKS